MFTGIIEQMGTLTAIRQEGKNKHFDLKADFYPEISIDQSIAHDGVCLTVVAKNEKDKTYTVTAIEETLKRSRLDDWRVGDKVNLERSLRLNDRLDGHIVQGHVDQVAYVDRIKDADGSRIFTFRFKEKPLHVLVEKGSVTVNGVSLTVFNIEDRSFDVAIIPYTYEHTNFHDLQPGDKVNIEFDMVGKYIERLAEQYLK